MAVRLVSVSHRFGAHVALRELSLHARPGDCYGFVGHNGAGKTTALRIAAGLIRPRRGRVLVERLDAARHPREARARVGALIDTPAFYDGWSGRRNLVALARLQGMTRPDAAREADRQLERVGLDAHGHRRVRAYSTGMRQRLGIAQALLGDPPVLLLDEPLNGLDPEGIAEIRDLLRGLNRDARRCIVISSHQLAEITDLCNRVGILREGRLLVEDETARLLEAGRRRYRVRTDDDAAAVAALERLGVERLDQDETGLLLDLGDRAPAEVARALVDAGRQLETLAPRPATLEAIYLAYTRSEGDGTISASAPGTEAPIEAATPSPRRAPRWPVLRLLRHEAVRFGPRAALLVLPAALAVGAIVRRHLEAGRDAAAVADEALFSATQVTAFEATARGLQAGLPLAVLVTLGLASQSVAAERARGTLRNILLRPVRRLQLVAAKALAALGAAAACHLVLALLTLAAAAYAFDFADLSELLPNGETMTLVPAAELGPALSRALLAPLGPLCAYAAVGFLAGTLVRGAAGALALSLGIGVLLDLSRTVARSFEAERWLPSAWLPSPLGDSSFIQVFLDISQGVSNAGAAPASPLAWPVLGWCAVPLALAALIMTRRTDVDSRS